MSEFTCELCKNWESIIDTKDIRFEYHGGGVCSLCAVPFTFGYDCKSCHDFVKDHTIYRYNPIMNKRTAVQLN